MAGSRIPGPTHYNPFSKLLPSRTPGPLGRNDAADPTAPSRPGDTFGPLGVKDYAEPMGNSALGAIPVGRLGAGKKEVSAAASDRIFGKHASAKQSLRRPKKQGAEPPE